MCSRYALTTDLARLPSALKGNFPQGFTEHYEKQHLIRPSDPVLVLKEENGIRSASFMLWGLLPDWSKDPLKGPRPFNARAETISTKPSFRGGWQHRRCLIPASGFYEKNHLIRREDAKAFWMGGIWNKWLGADGSEIQSCCVITTKPNDLLKTLHNRMPVIIPEGNEDAWIANVNGHDLKALEPLMGSWSSKGWAIEGSYKPMTGIQQMNLF